MRIFLSEYISGGALSGQPLPTSLLREGRAMRDAVAADLSRLADCRVVLTSDARVPPPDGVDVVRVESAEQEWRQFERLCRECDAALVIAPELDGELARRVRRASERCPLVHNCTPAAIDLCSDKLELPERLLRAGITTIPTVRLADVITADGWDDLPYPVVAKPRSGAGSQSVFRCDSAGELRQIAGKFDATRWEREAIVQPFLAGRALSAAVVFNATTGRPLSCFPTAAQRLTDDGRFTYLGGQVPAAECARPDWEATVGRIADEIPGLRGYVGFDLLCPTDARESWLVVEINPRLTTSYIGYRALAAANLTPLMIGTCAAQPVWSHQVVDYSADGACEAQTVQ